MPTDTLYRSPGLSPVAVEMWRNNLRKSQNQMPPVPVQTASATFGFDGVSSAPTVGSVVMVEIAFPCKIIGAHIYCGSNTALPITATSITIDLRLGVRGLWTAGSGPIWLTIPTLAAAPEIELDTTDWIVYLQPGDLLLARLASFVAVGASWTTLVLTLRKLDQAQLAMGAVTGDSGDTIVDGSGNRVVFR